MAEIRAELGEIDILVANAGIQRDAPSDELTLADWQKVLDVNSDRPIPVRARRHPGFQAAGAAAGGVAGTGQNHLHEFRPRYHPLGRDISIMPRRKAG